MPLRRSLVLILPLLVLTQAQGIHAQHPTRRSYISRTIVRHMTDTTGLPAGACALRSAAVPTTAGGDVPSVVLDSLVRAATAANSDALVVLRDGRLVGEWLFGRPDRPIETMSVTKAIVSLAIGHLVTTGRLPSLDVPVATYFPEWRQGRKAQITVRHLLTHTSGLQNEPNTGLEIEPAPDVVRLALAAELTHDPGSHVAYNNKAVNLLAGVVERASGMPLDRYLGGTVFRELCIGEFGWMHDPSGNPFAMSGAQLRARDLAAIGQLVLDGGRWAGRRIVSDAWVREATRPATPLHPRLGLIWRVLPGADSGMTGGEPSAVFHDGSFGQHLVVLPRTRTVVVRLIRRRDDHEPAHTMRDFVEMVTRLLGANDST